MIDNHNIDKHTKYAQKVVLTFIVCSRLTIHSLGPFVDEWLMSTTSNH